MVVTGLDILMHVPTVLDIGKEVQKFLIYYDISSARKLLHPTDEAYQSFVDKEQPNLFAL